MPKYEEDCEIGHRRDAYWLHVAESVLLKICATTGELRDQSGRRVQAAPAAAQMADELLEEAVKRRKI